MFFKYIISLYILLAFIIHIFFSSYTVHDVSLIIAGVFTIDVYLTVYYICLQADPVACLSTLTRLLDHALRVYPHNIKLLTLSANCKMYKGDNENTIKELLSCSTLLSGYSSAHIFEKLISRFIKNFNLSNNFTN